MFHTSAIGSNKHYKGKEKQKYDAMLSEKEECLIYLTLGDGDFTFSLDLAGWLSDATTMKCYNEESKRAHVRRTLVCTGLDSLQSLTEKYRDTPFILKQLSKYSSSDIFSVVVGHEVNAIESPAKQHDIAKQLPTHIVIFNHPHLATENAKLHSNFLHHLFHSVSHSYMAANGVFLLTLAQGQYERWDCERAAEKHGMKLVWRGVFRPPPLPTVSVKNRTYYSLRRHQTGKSFANRVLGTSDTFVFHRKEEMPDPQWKTHVEWIFSAPEGDVSQVAERHQQPGFHSCPHCDKEFSEKRSLKNHIQSKHGKRKRDSEFPCTICSQQDGVTRVFDSAQGLEDHMNVKHRAAHTTIRPDWCQTWNEKDADTAAVNHLPCSICGARLLEGDFDQAMKTHMESFLPQTERSGLLSFACSFCNRTFQEDRARLQHENHCVRKVATASVGNDGK